MYSTHTHTHTHTHRFILHPTKKIRDGLKKNRVETEEKIKAIKTQVTYWEKEVHSSEESLRDLVMQKR